MFIALRAELMELADMQDLGSCAARREGSNPSFRIDFLGGFHIIKSVCELVVSDGSNCLLFRWM